MPRIRAWSFSRWQKYDECPRKAGYEYIEKLPTLPKGPAAERGTRVHAKGEAYLTRQADEVPAAFKHFAKPLEALRTSGAVAEEKWCFTSSWKATDWYARNAWCRMIVDARLNGEDLVTIVDFKTGRVYPKHKQQADLYALGALLSFPDIEAVDVDFWYLDYAHEAHAEYSQADVPDLLKVWKRRTEKMLSDTAFKPKPSADACKWCDFHRKKGGPCEEGV